MGLRIIIAEKPSVAKHIADALKIKNNNDGFIEGNGYFITCTFGQLLRLFDAKEYDKKMGKWQMDYPYKVKKDLKKRKRRLWSKKTAESH